jgi:hypothetical protein
MPSEVVGHCGGKRSVGGQVNPGGNPAGVQRVGVQNPKLGRSSLTGASHSTIKQMPIWQQIWSSIMVQSPQVAIASQAQVTRASGLQTTIVLFRTKGGGTISPITNPVALLSVITRVKVTVIGRMAKPSTPVGTEVPVTQFTLVTVHSAVVPTGTISVSGVHCTLRSCSKQKSNTLGT